MTVYQKMLLLSEDIQKHIWCDLCHKKIFYKSQVVFEQGVFKDYYVVCPLINAAPAEYAMDMWKQKVAMLYSNYLKCVPKYTKIRNFRAADVNSVDVFSARDTFHHDRLALELYILFHGVQSDLQWKNINHFYEQVADGCVVDRAWLKP